jgi:[pyruvate, water dikinase]-phosphate phosphotransferase / [pyruvate, water dikinase] kinase
VDHKFHIHLVSDSTGETLNAMANAALAQFENVEVMIHPYALVRAEAQLTRALDHIAIMPGIVFFTLANPGLREHLVARCKDIEGRCASSWGKPKPTRSAASMRWTSAIWTGSRR